MTYLVSDIVGSTALGDTFDVEDVALAIGAAVAAAVHAIEGYGGVVLDVVGDGVIGAFGFGPDDVECAVRAGLDIVDAVNDQVVGTEPTEPGGTRVAAPVLVRVGVETSWRGSSVDRAVDAATQLEVAATAGAMLVGHRAWGLIHDRFLWEDAVVDARSGAPRHRPLAAVRVGHRRREDDDVTTLTSPVRQERKVVVAIFSGVEPLNGATDDGVLREALDIIERYGGLAKRTADRVVGLFGAPVVHEDDAERALHAGLEIVERAAEAGRTARLGVASGLALLGLHGAGHHVEYTALGDAVNTASRLQSGAAPGTVLVESQLYQRVASLFHAGRAEAFELKGKAHPVTAVVVTGVAERPPPNLRVGGPLVGRDTERRRLAGCVERFATGSGGFALIRGEAGMGKSRLALDVCAAASADVDDVRVVVVRCVSYAVDIPYWPLRATVTEWLERDGVADEDRAVLALVTAHPGRAAATDLAAVPVDAIHRRAVDAIVATWRRQHRVTPIMLVVEDVHWADRRTIDVIDGLLGETEVLVVATARPGDELVRDEIIDRPGLRIDLRPLTDADALGLLDALVGRAILPFTLERRILELAHGSPLFIEQLVHRLAGDGRLLRDDSGWRYVGDADVELPDTMERVVLGRIEQLPLAARATLDAVAVLGADATLDVLSAVTDAPGGVDEGIDLLIDAAILVSSSNTSAGYSFAHVLLQETCYRNLLRRDRRRLHQRAADALIRLRADEPRVWDDIARHSWESGDVAVAAEWAERAASHACDHLAFEQAARGYQLAAAAASSLPRDDTRAVRLGLALGSARRAAGLFGPAMETFAAVADLAAASGDVPGLAEAALGFEDVSFASRRPRRHHDDESVVLLERALDEAAEHGPALTARILASLAIAVSFSGDAERGRRLSDQALALARDSEPSVLAHALHAWRLARREPSFLADRHGGVQLMVAAAVAAGDRELELEAARLRLIDELELGRTSDADRTIAELDTLAHSLRQPQYLWYPTMWRAMRLLHRGRLADADAAIAEYHATGRRYGYRDIDHVHGLLLFLVRREQSRAGEIEELCQRLAVDTPRWQPVMTALDVEMGRLDEARATLDDYVASGFAQVPRDQAVAAQIVLLTDAALATGHTAAAEGLRELALPMADQQLVVGSGAVCFGAAAHVLGLLAATTGRRREAAGWFRRAIAQNRFARSPLWMSYSVGHAALVVEAPDPVLVEQLARADRVARTTGSVRLAQLVDRARTTGETTSSTGK